MKKSFARTDWSFHVHLYTSTSARGSCLVRHLNVAKQQMLAVSLGKNVLRRRWDWVKSCILKSWSPEAVNNKSLWRCPGARRSMYRFLWSSSILSDRTRFWPGQVFWIARMFVWISLTMVRCTPVFNMSGIFGFILADLACVVLYWLTLLGIFLSVALLLTPFKCVSFIPPHDHYLLSEVIIQRCSQLRSHSSVRIHILACCSCTWPFGLTMTVGCSTCLPKPETPCDNKTWSWALDPQSHIKCNHLTSK